LRAVVKVPIYNHGKNEISIPIGSEIVGVAFDQSSRIRELLTVQPLLQHFSTVKYEDYEVYVLNEWSTSVPNNATFLEHYKDLDGTWLVFLNKK
jgi:hypothetical protein